MDEKSAPEVSFANNIIKDTTNTPIAESAPQKSSNIWKSMTFKEKTIYFCRNITVEPILACYIIPAVLSGIGTQNLNLEKACSVNLNYSDEVCSALARRDTANYTSEDQNVQLVVANMNVWKFAMQSGVPIFLNLFLGSWTDRHGRKLCMILPIFGECITSAAQMLTVYYRHWSIEITGFIEGIFVSITGGPMTMNMAVFSYIADITTEEMRTVRVGFINVFSTVGIPIGSALSGILYLRTGYYGVFGITSGLFGIGVLYAIIRIKNVIPESAQSQREMTCCEDLFDVRHVVDTFKVTFKKREGQKRLKIILLMVACFVVEGPNAGEYKDFVE